MDQQATQEPQAAVEVAAAETVPTADPEELAVTFCQILALVEAVVVADEIPAVDAADSMAEVVVAAAETLDLSDKALMASA